MRFQPTIAAVVAGLFLLIAVHLHDSAHRFDVVVAAGGSGGSQNETGYTVWLAYLVDHKTGNTWLLQEYEKIPVSTYVPKPAH